MRVHRQAAVRQTDTLDRPLDVGYVRSPAQVVEGKLQGGGAAVETENDRSGRHSVPLSLAVYANEILESCYMSQSQWCYRSTISVALPHAKSRRAVRPCPAVPVRASSPHSCMPL